MKTVSYLSTRGPECLGSFSDILLQGLAPDGGLAIPSNFKVFDNNELLSLSKMSYSKLASKILSCFVDDIDIKTINSLCDSAYTVKNFGTQEITPLVHLGEEENTDIFLLELSNGPTLAFKDIAMQMLGQLFEYVLDKKGLTLNILGATSGDTGSAAEYAMRDKSNISVFMLSPEGRMSSFQKAQMYSLMDERIHNIVVPGTFDICQDLVKGVSSDLKFKNKYRIGSVNSINWGRISSQIVYYFYGYFRTIEKTGNRFMSPVSFSVPSGNFGNILSGYVAKKMGLPIENLVLATNENDVLDEFFKTGKYRVRPLNETFKTSSPSMDISKASNFERFIFDVVKNDFGRVNTLWNKLNIDGNFTIEDEESLRFIKKSGIISGSSNHQNRLATIKNIKQKYDRTIDPHTADGIFVARKNLKSKIPMVCLETALPIKFSETVFESIGKFPQIPKKFFDIEGKPQKVKKIDANVEILKKYIKENSI